MARRHAASMLACQQHSGSIAEALCRTYCDAVHVEDGCDGCTGRKDQRLEVREVRLLVVREYLAWGEYFLVPQRPWSMRTLSW